MGVYRITSSNTRLQKIFSPETPDAYDIIPRLEKANDEGSFWNFWDVMEGSFVDVNSLEPIQKDSLYTYWWDDPSVGKGWDQTCPRREVYSLEDLEELREDYGDDWKKYLDTVEVLKPYSQPLEATDARMFEYLDYVNDKTGWDLQVTLPLPPLTEQQQAVVKELAEAERLMIRTDIDEGQGLIGCRHKAETTYSIVASPESRADTSSDDDPEDWENISEILGLKDDVKFTWTFESWVEGNAEEASAAEKVAYSTWGEEKLLDFLGLGNEWEPDLDTGAGYATSPDFMGIKHR